MTRITVSLSDDLSEWVENKASSRNASKAQIIRDAVGLAKESDASKENISVVQSDEVTERLDELEARVAELESRASQQPTTDAAESSSERIEQEPASPSQSASDDLSPASNALDVDVDVSDDVESSVEMVSEGWDDAPNRLRARKNAAAMVLQHALDSSDAVGKSSEIVAKARERHPVEGQNPETFYRKNIRPVLKKHGTYSQGRHGYVISGL
jgi:predicted transcriptional regulator